MRRYILVMLTLCGIFLVFLLLRLAVINIPNQFKMAIGTEQSVYLISKSFSMKKVFTLKDLQLEDDFSHIKLASFWNSDTLFLYVIGKKEKRGYFVKVNIHSGKLSKENSPVCFRKLKSKKTCESIIVGIEEDTDNIFVLDQHYRIKKSLSMRAYNKILKNVSKRVLPEPSFRVPPSGATGKEAVFWPIDVDIDEKNNIIISGSGGVQIVEISENGDFVSAIDLMDKVDEKYAKKYDYLSVEQLESIDRDRFCILAHFSTRWDAGPQEKMLAIYNNVVNKLVFTLTNEDVESLDIYTEPGGVLDLFGEQHYIDPYYFNVSHDRLLIANFQHEGSASCTVIGIDFKKKLVLQFPENYIQDLMFKDIGYINYIDLL